jgi:hypothetical protein
MLGERVERNSQATQSLVTSNSEGSLNDMLECQDEVVNLNTSDYELKIENSIKTEAEV